MQGMKDIWVKNKFSFMHNLSYRATREEALSKVQSSPPFFTYFL